MNTYKKVLVLLFLSTTAMAGAQPTDSSKLKDDLRKYIEVLYAKRSFSGEILIAQDNNIVSWESIGMASEENNIPVQRGANYRIASITKTFTASLIALAQQEQS